MRVIAGTLGGRRLRAPDGTSTRPTSDRVREALFSSLAPALHAARVLDLFAGSGALGIEALSRGAASAVFCETDRRARRVLTANLEATGLTGRAEVRAEPAERVCRRPPPPAFDVVLADPPYAMPLAAVWACLTALHAAGGLAVGSRVVVERARRDPDLGTAPPHPLVSDRARPYGDTMLLHLTSTSAGAAPWA